MVQGVRAQRQQGVHTGGAAWHDGWNLSRMREGILPWRQHSSISQTWWKGHSHREKARGLVSKLKQGEV